MIALHQIDVNLFYFFNHLPHNSVFDALAKGLHLLTNFGGIYYIVLAIFLLSKNSQRRLLGKFGAVSALATYVVSNWVLKVLIQRPRPYQVLRNVIYLPPAPGNFSFPSGEAAVAAAMATMFILVLPKKAGAYLMCAFALAVFLDRIYMGHHYPSDVAAGAGIGVVISLLVYKFWEKKSAI